MTRTGEWSPICKAYWWDDGPDIGGPQVGAHFSERNETSGPVTLAAIKRIAEAS